MFRPAISSAACTTFTKALFIASLWGLSPAAGAAAPAAVLVVPAEKSALDVAVPLPEGAPWKCGEACRLVEVDRPDAPVAAQIVPAVAADGTASPSSGQLLVVIPPRADSAGPRRFRVETAAQKPADAFSFADIDRNSLRLAQGDKPVLVYNHGLITCERVPENNPLRRRACYVHPLWGLGGEVLTDDFPKDHYHHHGVFWTWPHVSIEGQEYNIWAGDNIHDKFARWLCRDAGPVAATLAVENGWFVGERKVMIERVWLRAFRDCDAARALDIALVWIPVDAAVTLRGAEGKSYGGLTVRFAVKSPKDALITVPSGRTTDDLPDTRLEWADLTQKFGESAAPSGAAIFVHPEHPDYPPTWLTRHYGAMCVGYPGVKGQTFPPGKPIGLRYRLWIHRDAVEPDQLRQAYEGYTAATKVKWE